MIYQDEVNRWMHRCFPREIIESLTERNFRFLEEALELVQSTNLSREDAHKLVDYVYDRPIGRPSQEVGGVMVCLAALCNLNGINISQEMWAELARIEQPSVIEKIRQKHAEKPVEVKGEWKE